MLQAALFDLDGVVFNTEPQYTEFWGRTCRTYRPDLPGLEHTIKGQTLTQIFDQYFSDEADRRLIVDELNYFEQNMRFDYIDGFLDYLSQLRALGVSTAVVTSSNQAKMQSVYRQHPECTLLFDAILTAEDFAESKPHPDCYLRAAARFGAPVDACVVFEDSINGLKSGRAARMCVIGLATTLPAEVITPLANDVISDYTTLSVKKTEQIMSLSR